MSRIKFAVEMKRTSEPAPQLLDRIVHRGESGIERRADPIDGGENHDADADRDQAIFNRGSAGLIHQKVRLSVDASITPVPRRAGFFRSNINSAILVLNLQFDWLRQR